MSAAVEVLVGTPAEQRDPAARGSNGKRYSKKATGEPTAATEDDAAAATNDAKTDTAESSTDAHASPATTEAAPQVRLHIDCCVCSI